jgi:hypothetical protein
MTPNQTASITQGLAQLLESGHDQGLTPVDRAANVNRRHNDYIVNTTWTDPEGAYVSLAVLVHPDGTTTPLDALTVPLTPTGQPGVRTDQHGRALYSADWLSSDPTV